MAKEVFEHTLGYARSTTGTSPFTRDVDHGTLKIDRWLGPEFKTGDTVRVTVEKIDKQKSRNNCRVCGAAEPCRASHFVR